MTSVVPVLADPRQRAIAPRAALAAQASLTTELIQLYSNYFSPGRPLDWLHLNGRGRVFSNELVVMPLDVNTPKGMQVFPPMLISGLKFIFDFIKAGQNDSHVKAYIGVDPVVWGLRDEPATSAHLNTALELLQQCAARANHDYFHHYTSTPKPFADALIAACDPLEKGFHGYSGYEVCSIMMHQLLLKAADNQHGKKLSAQSLREAKDFYSTLAKLADALDPKIARQLCPYLSTIYLHFYQLSWGKTNISTANGIELVRAMNEVNVQARWDTAESVHLLDQMRSQVLFNFINGLTTDTMGILRLPVTFTTRKSNRFKQTFAEGTLASVSAHFSDVETAWNHTEHVGHFHHARQIISAHYREQFSVLEWLAAPAGTLYHDTLRR